MGACIHPVSRTSIESAIARLVGKRQRTAAVQNLAEIRGPIACSWASCRPSLGAPILPTNGRDGFHSVPNILSEPITMGTRWNASLPTRSLASCRPFGGFDSPHVGCYGSTPRCADVRPGDHTWLFPVTRGDWFFPAARDRRPLSYFHLHFRATIRCLPWQSTHTDLPLASAKNAWCVWTSILSFG